ncbi:uncharacterized protein G2W53_001478 [Senna tora]|uniref:Uncharacterized protein n=1 Tax=Senna tora TaxID=362788 RepID=A0A834XJR7_9FABA|nr:uncharacterized protein G2W53_001478 [Senna tora]
MGDRRSIKLQSWRTDGPSPVDRSLSDK